MGHFSGHRFMVVECVIGEVANFGLFFKKYLKERIVQEMSLCEFIVKNNRNSHRRCSLEKTVLKNFVIFTGKCLCVKSLFNKVAGLQVCNFIEMKLQHRCFPVNTTKFLRTPILSIFERLLLKHCNFFKNSFYEKQKENILSFFKKTCFYRSK